MSFLRDIRGFIRAFRERRADPRISESLARTLKESTHVRGAYGGLARAGTEAHHDIAAEGHQSYVESFDDED